LREQTSEQTFELMVGGSWAESFRVNTNGKDNHVTQRT